MTDIKKINIYMGIVGQAYVDKETASKNLEAALKNIQDVNEIITLATNYLNAASDSLIRANYALDFASRIKDELEYKKTQVPQDSAVYNQIVELIQELSANDNDDNYLNGGNINTAHANVNNINDLINELNDIKSTAETLLDENTSYKDQCQTAFDTAKATFESYIPTEEESQADKSDQLEAELLERLNNAATGIEVANQITDAINEVSNHFQNESNNIVIDDQPGGGDEPGGGDTPIQYTVTLNVINGSKFPEESQVVEAGGTVTFTVFPNSGYEIPASIEGAIISGNFVTIRNVSANIELVCECLQSQPEEQYYYYAGWTLPTTENAEEIINETYPIESGSSETHVAGKKTTSKSSFSLATVNLYYSVAKANYYVLVPTGHAIYDTVFGQQMGSDSFTSEGTITVGNQIHTIYKSVETTRNITSIEIK